MVKKEKGEPNDPGSLFPFLAVMAVMFTVKKGRKFDKLI